MLDYSSILTHLDFQGLQFGIVRFVVRRLRVLFHLFLRYLIAILVFRTSSSASLWGLESDAEPPPQSFLRTSESSSFSSFWISSFNTLRSSQSCEQYNYP